MPRVKKKFENTFLNLKILYHFGKQTKIAYAMTIIMFFSGVLIKNNKKIFKFVKKFLLCGFEKVITYDILYHNLV